MRIRPRVLLGVAALVAAGAAHVPAGASPTAGYVVTLAPGASQPQVLTLTRALGGKVGFVYENALHGFSVQLPIPALATLRALPGVAAVQADQVVHVDATRVRTQSGPPSYGLDRIDQRSLPLNNRYSYRGDGSGVTAYVIDTGIRYDHVDFGGRAVRGFDAVTKGGGADDCYGHGTHVAGTIGGRTFGVAKNVRLVGVRVLDCNGSGTTSEVVAGLDWVVGNHRAGQPAVANMSLSGGQDSAIDAAVQKAISDGITFGVAAGNDGGFLTDLLGSSNACNNSPSDVPAALTVAATDSTDTRASYSDTGPCVDIWAPGSDITSDYNTSRTATTTMSGTSMATPHVVGTAAVYLSSHRTATPSQVANALVGASTKGVVQNAPSDTANRLLFQGW